MIYTFYVDGWLMQPMVVTSPALANPVPRLWVCLTRLGSVDQIMLSTGFSLYENAMYRHCDIN
jgi:hypothetical protein